MRSICKIDGCETPVIGLGYCNKHYRRLRAHGDPSIVREVAPGNVQSWLASHVDHNGADCLIFPFAKNRRGYGVIGFSQFSTAHRWMCHEAHGPAPEGKPFALHDCGRGTDGCVNPRHLYWGSGVDNYQDQIRHGVVARGERSGKATLSEAKVVQIRKLRQAGRTLKSIAKEVGAETAAVRSVVRGRTWAWL